VTRGTLIYIGQRLILIVFTALAVSSLVFLLLHQIPGNAFTREALHNPQAEQALLHHYGLDLPLSQQYLNFMGGLLHGDLGESLVNRGTKITPLLIHEAGVSAILGAAALVFTIGVGMFLGVIAAVRQNTLVDYAATSASVVGYSMPNFVIATILVLVTAKLFYIWTNGAFYYEIGWGSGSSIFPKPQQIIVPALALGLPYASIVTRITRASMLETIRQDYVRTARAKGLEPRLVIVRHALRNALIPVVTIIGPLTTGIITGVVVIENIFGIPGLGKEFIESILNRDYNIVIGTFTFFAALTGLANLAVDVLYPLLDPRIRY
jgi:ABC-type dipeptide/oligopeptide/nickel transport system permease component